MAEYVEGRAAVVAASGEENDMAFPALPELERWEANMLVHGAVIGDKARHSLPESVGTDGPEDVTFYDGARVFYQIADYTRDPAWNEPARACARLYRESMVLAHEGSVHGWRIFPHGLYEDYRRTGDERSRHALLLLARHGHFGAEGTPPEATENEALSREVAYNLNTFLAVMKLGEPQPARLALLYEHALGHLEQWFVQESCDNYAPFMFGLTAEALISYFDQVAPDPRVPAGLQRGCDWTWEHAWLPEHEAFWYRLDQQQPAPTLKQLVAPVYAWVARQTGELRYLEQGDRIFAGGAKYADLNGGKTFNQNYRWSFAYLQWRADPLRSR